MRVRVIQKSTGRVVLFALSERIARNQIAERGWDRASLRIEDDEPCCPDCGEPGERMGHQGCQYPTDGNGY